MFLVVIFFYSFSIYSFTLSIVFNAYKTARAILFLKREDHITPLFKQLHWLPVSDKIKYKINIQTSASISLLPLVFLISSNSIPHFKHSTFQTTLNSYLTQNFPSLSKPPSTGTPYRSPGRLEIIFLEWKADSRICFSTKPSSNHGH